MVKLQEKPKRFKAKRARSRYNELSDIPKTETKKVPGLGTCYKLKHVCGVFGIDPRTVKSKIEKGEWFGEKIGYTFWVGFQQEKTGV